MNGNIRLRSTYNYEMLTAAARSRLAVVLVGARNPQNIGAVARAMHDFGFSDLRVVNPFTLPFEAAQMEATSAVNAGTVMRSARVFSSLPEAIADCGLVAGTTAVGERGLRQPVFTLQEVAPTLLAAMSGDSQEEHRKTPESAEDGAKGTTEKIALLFGSEKTGLTKEDLSYCSLLLTIPMFAPEGRHLSMNLGQAAAVCLYELTRLGFEGARAIPTVTTKPASVQDEERLLAMLLQTMESSGYTRRFPANARLEVVRPLARQMSTTVEQSATWMGFFRQIARALGKG